MSMVHGDALSLLLFRLHSGRLLGSTCQVQEIIPCPALTKLPSRHLHVRGVTTPARVGVDGNRPGQGHRRAGFLGAMTVA